MNEKLKNWILFIFQLSFFTMVTLIIIFLEFLWIYEIYFYPLNFPFPHPPSNAVMPSMPKVIISILFVSLIILNLSIAIFSMYGFIFFLHVLDSNPAKTAPVCAMSIDITLLNFFLYQLSVYEEQYIAYFVIPFPLFFIFIPLYEVLIAISVFSIALNLEFGIEGIVKRHIINSNWLTDFIHYLLILNGILGSLYLYICMNVFNIKINSFIIGITLGIFFIGLFNIGLRKLHLNNYPIEALAILKYGRVPTKHDDKETQ